LADVVGSSERWGVAKPDPAFFQRLIAEAGCAPDEILYVGDRVDNDVLPALAAGLQAIHLARGPWGVVQARWPEAAGLRRIRLLAELPAMLA
jgi:FMN phosphatase YigB (HAD superfamily)